MTKKNIERLNIKFESNKNAYLAVHRIHIKKFTEGGIIMANKERNPEEQRLKARRRLIKLAVYSIPAIATSMAAQEVYANGDDDERPKPRKYRQTPRSQKVYPSGLS